MQDRRNFLKRGGAAAMATGLAAAFTPASYARIVGANDRVHVAVAGVRSRGAKVAQGFAQVGADVAQVYDVDSRVEAKILKTMADDGYPVPVFGKDFRSALDDKHIDVLAIATPDHWHAPAALMAMAAGKHVYVEKPCGHNVSESAMLVAAQQKTGLHVQMGNQQRSAPETQELVARIRAGELGEIYRVDTFYANARKPLPPASPAAIPDWLDWELWQGPAPRREFEKPWVHYNWHWSWHWGTGEVCNNGAHELDIARWIIGARHPEQVSVQASRRFQGEGAWEMYDTMEAAFLYPGGVKVVWDGSSCNKVERRGRGRGTLAYGTKGSVLVDRGGYELYDLAGKLTYDSKEGGKGSESMLTPLHTRNLMEVIQGKQGALNSPISEGAISTDMCHLANIAYRAGTDLTIDPATGAVAQLVAAQYLGRDYEAGWMPVI